MTWHDMTWHDSASPGNPLARYKTHYRYLSGRSEGIGMSPDPICKKKKVKTSIKFFVSLGLKRTEFSFLRVWFFFFRKKRIFFLQKSYFLSETCAKKLSKKYFCYKGGPPPPKKKCDFLRLFFTFLVWKYLLSKFRSHMCWNGWDFREKKPPGKPMFSSLDHMGTST